MVNGHFRGRFAAEVKDFVVGAAAEVVEIVFAAAAAAAPVCFNLFCTLEVAAAAPPIVETGPWKDIGTLWRGEELAAAADELPATEMLAAVTVVD